MTGAAAGPDELLLRLRNFKSDYFPLHQQRFQDLVNDGQHPKTLLLGVFPVCFVHNFPAAINTLAADAVLVCPW